MNRPFPDGVAAIRVPDECEVLEAAKEAMTRGMFLITDGHETLLSPIVMPGWYRLGVSVKEAA